MGETDSLDPLLGRTIGDAYVLQDLVGVGGMGRVYRGEQRALGRTVAIKVIHRHLLGDNDSVSRFYTEARAASSLNHPNSVSIFDFGRTDDGVLYLVMEYLRGKDLARIMQEEGPLPIVRIVDIVCGVLAALAEAHERGVIHCDLKPENVILERMRGGADLVKVVDFGLAKIRGAEPDGDEAKGLVSGTPDYMAPEQARAMPVDGRGDLYALGVVLFELLTGRLPFSDDTPSKVMMRHVMEAPPNPIQIAPYRGIPEPLAEAVLKALAKDPLERYQDADAMARELRKAVVSVHQSGGDQVRCPGCGSLNPAIRSFCGDCGTRLPTSAGGTTGSGLSIPPRGERPLLGRESELTRLGVLRREAQGEPRVATIHGEAGIGKTRLLTELMTQAEREGDVVVLVGPHPSGAPVPYGPIRACVAGLLNVDEARLNVLARDHQMWRDRLSLAGIEELCEPRGLPGFPGKSRHSAVASALARAAELASSRADMGRVVLLFDDLARCDGLTTEVLAVLPDLARARSLFLVAASRGPTPLSLRWAGPSLHLGGLPASEVHQFVKKEFPPPVMEDGGILPLHMEQLRALRWESTLEERNAPDLGDAVGRRLATLDVTGRRVMQAAAVLGEVVDVDALKQMVSSEDLKSMDKLARKGFFRFEGNLIRFAHHYLRDFVEASIPAETRKLMHARALELTSQTGAPLEVRAEHAFRAGEAMTALMLLERMGADAEKRGDPSVAVLAFRRGLDMARREMLEKGDTSLDPAIATFSRDLAEAMERDGDPTAAAGVLNEALDLAGPHSAERARMLLVLGRVAERRDRPREALMRLGQAAELAQSLDRPELMAQAQCALARVRREDGDHVGAANSLSTALQALDSGSDVQLRASLCLELGELFVDMGDVEGANNHLEQARQLASEAKLDALAASALGVIASIDELAGRRDQAASRYREAAKTAASAGDARGRDRWRRAAQVLAGG